jgi:hypothetical protein
MTNLFFQKKVLKLLVSALSFFLISCSSSNQLQRALEEQISKGEYLQAIETVKKNKTVYGEKNSVLYKLDLGLLFHYAGIPDSSNRYFFSAEKEIDDLYTQSISQHALSFLLNDNILPYEGEDFEKVLVNILLALNFIEKDLPDEALVEARKVDLKLREYSRQYEGKNKYQEDAFIRYLAGALYESGGEINDAFISYRKSFESYKTYLKEYGTHPPNFLIDDLVRTATLMGFKDEADYYKTLDGKPYTQNSDGSVLIIVYSGKGPVKTEIRPTVSIPDSAGIIHTFQVALPKFVSRHKQSRSYNIKAVSLADTVSRTAQLAEDITAIAEKTLDDRLTYTYLKSGGRALLKFLASEKMKKELNKDSNNKGRNLLGSIAIDLVMGATEQADTRTWQTLPAEIQLGRVNLPPGKYNLTIESSDGGYHLRDEVVNVKGGKSSFIIIDDIR